MNSSEETRPALFLIDGYAQFFRAYHAIRTPMSSPVTSEPTHMTFGFMRMLLNLLRDYSPEHLALVMDVSGDKGTFRNELYPEYKANRDPPPSDLKPQVDRCLELLKKFGVPIYGVEGFEADDVIATIVTKMRAECPEVDVRIVSKDKDLQQLLADNVAMLNLKKDPDPDEFMDPPWLLEQKGITPEQVVDMLALMGDTADNVPGVDGIGPKTAAQLIGEMGSIEGIYDRIDAEEELPVSKRTIKGKRLENLVAARSNIPLGIELITLRRDCDIEFALEDSRVDAKNINLDGLIEDMRELGFRKHQHDLRDWVLEARGEKPAEPDSVSSKSYADTPEAGSLFGAAMSGPIDAPQSGDYSIITTEKELDSYLKKLSKADRIAVDTETDGLIAPVVPMAGVCLSSSPGEGVYIPVSAPSGTSILDKAMVIDRIRPLLENPNIPKFGHNIKFDINVLRNHGISLKGIGGDTMVESYVHDATRSSHGMDALSERFLGRMNVPISAVIGKGKSQIVFSEAPLEKAGPYAAEDADVTLQLADHLDPLLESEGLRSLYEQTELPLVEVLAELEFNGIRVDAEELDRQRDELIVQSDRLRQEIIDASPHPFSPDSPRQLAAALFNAPGDDPPGLGIKPIKKGKTGPSTDAGVLEKLANDPDVETVIPAKIIEYRQLMKLINTYLLALKDAIQPSTGRIHASFNQVTTATGRLSSSDPNLQNIPIRTEVGRRIRRAFIADPGNVLLAGDYSQIELRMLAHLSQDESLISAFEAGADIHTAVASEVFGIPIEEVTSEERNGAKMVNFGIVYGITSYGLASRLGGDTSVARAAGIIEDYKARFPGIDSFLQSCIDQAADKGCVETILGRRRPIPQIHSRNPNERALGERMAINTVVQGSAADLIKLAMLDLYRTLPEKYPDLRMLLQIHDELVFEVSENEVGGAWDFIKARMEAAMELRVPLVVDGSWGKSWAETK